GKFLKSLSPRPGVMETVDRNRNNWHLQVDGQDRRTFFEGSGCSINAALALWIQDEGHALTQSEGSGTHRRNKVRIRIHDHHSQNSRRGPHESGAENLACTHGERAVQDAPWQ